MSEEATISVTDAMQPAILLAGIVKDMGYLKQSMDKIEKSTGDLSAHVAVQNGRIGKGEGRASAIIMSAGVVVVLGGIILSLGAYVFTSTNSSIQSQLNQMQKNITNLETQK